MYNGWTRAKLKFCRSPFWAIGGIELGRSAGLDFRPGISLSDSTAVRLIDSGRMLGIWDNLMDEIITWTDLKMLECVEGVSMVFGN